MEDGLRGAKIAIERTKFEGLNPCCYGRWSQSYSTAVNALEFFVLILVVMEDGLRVILKELKPLDTQVS